MRLDMYVAQQRPEHSRSSWQKFIEAGHVTVNGSVQTVGKYDVKESDKIEVNPPEPTDYSTHELPIIYEDDNVIVVDKPLGILTHSKGAMNDEFTVAEFVRPKTSYKQDSNRPGIIHRLDRATSGIIVCVKNDETASYLQEQFSDRKVKKKYTAVLAGVPKENEAIVDLPIGRNPNAPSTFKVDINGKTAETYYEVLKHGTDRTLVNLFPKTGRTHQLRVHMAYLTTPILGDVIYGKTKADRMYLHATSLELTLPGGIRTVFNSPVPASFEREAMK